MSGPVGARPPAGPGDTEAEQGEPARAQAAAVEALTSSAMVAALARDTVAVEGPDAESYLQGQLSQDVSVLAPGAAAMSFVLSPDGRIDLLVRVVRTSKGFRLDCDEGYGQHLRARLERFRVRVEVSVAEDHRGYRAVRGPASISLADVLRPRVEVLPCFWPAVAGFDIAGEGDSVDEADVAGTVAGDAASLEAWRIVAGMPKMGAEIAGSVTPAETGLVDLAVSFTKGCYTGQELVERVDARGGNVPWRLRHVVSSGSLPEGRSLGVPGADGGEAVSGVGGVTSVAIVPRTPSVVGLVDSGDGGGPGHRDGAGGRPDGTITVCLAYVHRKVAVGSTVIMGSRPHAPTGTVREVPADRPRVAT